MSAWFGRNVVTYLLMDGASDLPWMLWQLLQVTSFSWCLPDVQNARLRLLEWQPRHTAVRSSAVWPGPNGLAGLAFIGSLRCSLALPWHAWHMLPSASFFAPWGERSIARHCASWQFAQTGATGPVGCCASAGKARSAAQIAQRHGPATKGIIRIGIPLSFRS